MIRNFFKDDVVFLRDIQEGNLSLEDDEVQGQLINELKDMDKVRKYTS